jgi:hypothetical protein
MIRFCEGGMGAGGAAAKRRLPLLLSVLIVQTLGLFTTPELRRMELIIEPTLDLSQHCACLPVVSDFVAYVNTWHPQVSAQALPHK